MTAVRLALLELRRFRGSPTRHLTLVTLVLMPLLFGGFTLWSHWDPFGHTDRIPVAVVNQDTGTTLAGERLDAGAEFIAQLRATPRLDWNFVSAPEARAGMEAGDYYFAIVVPEDFSSTLAGQVGTDPAQAHITVELDDANGYVAGVMAKTMANELHDQINTAAYVTFAKSMFGDLTALDAEMTDTADAATRLAGSADDTANTAADLNDDLAGLDTAAVELSDGVNQLHHTVQTGTQLVGSWPGIQSGAQETADLTAGFSGRLEDVYARLCADEAAETPACQEFQLALADSETIADSVRQVNGDIQQLSAEDLTTASDQVQRLVRSTDQLSAGLSDAVEDSAGLADETELLADGYARQAGMLSGAAIAVPAMNPEQNAVASAAMSSPVSLKETNANPVGVHGRGVAPFWFAIALWMFGLVAYQLLRSHNPRALAGRTNAVAVAVAGWLPAFFLGVVGALVLYLTVDMGLGLDPVNVNGTVGLVMLGAAVFTALAHLLRLALGAVGSVLIMVLLVLQLASSGSLYPMETAPAVFQGLHAILPMTYLVDGLRITISGGSPELLWRDVLVLLGFGLAAVAASTVVVMRQRRWTIQRLHPPIDA